MRLWGGERELLLVKLHAAEKDRLFCDLPVKLRDLEAVEPVVVGVFTGDETLGPQIFYLKEIICFSHCHCIR
jgi:hypothetical protein